MTALPSSLSAVAIVLRSLAVRAWRIALPVALFGLLLLSTLFVVHRYRVCNSGCFHSDDLYCVEVCKEILGRVYERTHLHFPYAPMVFPEQLLMLPCVALFKDLVRIFAAYNVLYHVLSMLVLTALFRQTGLGRRESFLFGCISQLFLLSALLEPSSLGWIPFVVCPASHTGAILIGLMLWLLVIRNLHQPIGWKGALLFVVVGGLAIFSDRIVVGQFLGPICLAVVGLTLFRAVPLRKGVETIVLGGASFGCALAIQSLVERWHFHVLTVGVLTDFSKSQEAAERLQVDVPSYLQGEYLVIGVVCALLLLAPITGLYHIFLARRQRRAAQPSQNPISVGGWRPQVATGVLLAAAWLGCVCPVAALIVSGVGRLGGTQRYLLGCFCVPFLFLPICLRFLPGRLLQRLGGFVPLVLVLFAVYQISGRQDAPVFAFRDLRQPYPEVCQMLDRLTREGKIHRGIATYWNSRKNLYLCRENVQIKTVLSDGNPWIHLQNPNSFLAPDSHCLEVPRYDFILFNDKELSIPLPKADICRLFGSPREQVRCGDYEIWIYDGLISSPFTLFLRSMLANRCRAQLKWTGPDQPSQLSHPTLNFTTNESANRTVLQPDGAVQVTYASPVRGKWIDVGAEFDSHFQVTFHHGDEDLGTVPVPRANFPFVASPHGLPGIQSRLVTVPVAAQQRGWTSATIRSGGRPGNFVLSHFLVYPDAERVTARQMFPGGRWRFEAELQHSWIAKDSVALDPLASEGKARFAPATYSGCPTAGPFLYLEPGRYRVEYFLKAGPTKEPWPVCTLDVASEGGKKVHVQRNLEPAGFVGREGYQKFCLEFESDIDLVDCEFRVIAYGRADLYVDRIELVCLR